MNANINEILRNAYVESGAFHNVVSLIKPKGRFLFNHKKYEEFFKNYCESIADNKNYKFGIAEKPQFSLPVLVDVDLKIVKNGDPELPLTGLYTQTDINKLIHIYQAALRKIVIGIKEENLVCVVLEKPINFKMNGNEATIKNGFHLHFPCIFLSKEEQQTILIPIVKEKVKVEKILPKFKNIIDNAVCKVPWLLYGSRKAQDSEPYLYTRAVDSCGVDIQLEQAFSNYKLYDKHEDLIDIKGKVEYYLPRILSIIGSDSYQFECVKTYNRVVSYLEDEEDSSDIEDEILFEEGETETNIDYSFLFECFDNLADWRWHSYKDWIFSCFLALNLGLTSEDIHTLCSKSDNYYKNNGINKTQELINSFNKTKGRGFNFDILYNCLKKDNYLFVKKHQSKFKNLVTQAEQEKTMIPVPLDDIEADEIIDSKNVGSYENRLKQHNVLCIRSGMNSMKTQNLKGIIGDYKRVLFITFRIALAVEMKTQFKKWGFDLYNELKGEYYTSDRLIVSIDSLAKVRGPKDLIILDEFTYTTNHLTNFKMLKEKHNIYRVLTDYVKETPKVIVLDGLLDKFSVDYFRRHRGNDVLVIDNKFKTFKRTAVYREVKAFNSVLELIEDFLLDGKKVVVPTNSKKFGNALYALTNKNYKVCYINADRDNIETAKWGDYDLLIYTPTIVAGQSYIDKHFDERVSFFTNCSCNAYLASQMIFRVRNIINEKEYIFVSNNKRYFMSLPKTEEDLEICLSESIDSLSTLGGDFTLKTSGLEIKNTQNRFINSGYYKLFRHNLNKENQSRMSFGEILVGNLESHGIVFDFLKAEKVPLKLTEEQNETIKDYNDSLIEEIVNSNTLTVEQYQSIEKKYVITPEEKNQVHKFLFLNCFNVMGELNIDLYKKFNNHKTKYRILCFLKNTPDYMKKIEDELNYFKERYKTLSKYQVGEVLRLTETSKNCIKIFWCLKLLNVIGFQGPFDLKTIKNLPYEKMVEFMLNDGENCQSVWNDKKLKDKQINNLREFLKNPNPKWIGPIRTYITKFFTGKLTETLGIDIKNIGSNKLETKKYVIRHKVDFEGGGISFKINNNIKNQLFKLKHMECYEKPFIRVKNLKPTLEKIMFLAWKEQIQYKKEYDIYIKKIKAKKTNDLLNILEKETTNIESITKELVKNRVM